MPLLDILARNARLSAVNLTIREATRLAENPLDLRYRALFPAQPSNSLKVRDLTKVDFRPTAEYRAWNAVGREIHEVLGPQAEWEMLPVTAEHHIDERRLLELSLPDPSIRQLVDNGVVKDVDQWATALADAVERRLEVAAFAGWLTNALTFMDPKTGTVVTAALGFAAARYVTEGTAWNTVANAYDRLVFHLGEARRLTGSLGAVRMRNSTLAEVVKDAPAGPNAIRPTILNVEDRLREQGFDVTLIADERTYDKYTDGGTAYTTTYYVPTGKVAFQPADGQIGNTFTVPSMRAKELVTNTRVNRNDVVVWYTEQNRGQTLLMEAERIAVPMPSEQRVYVVDALF